MMNNDQCPGIQHETGVESKISRQRDDATLQLYCHHALFGAHMNLSETVLKKERKLMMEKSNEDPEGDGG